MPLAASKGARSKPCDLALVFPSGDVMHLSAISTQPSLRFCPLACLFEITHVFRRVCQTSTLTPRFASDPAAAFDYQRVPTMSHSCWIARFPLDSHENIKRPCSDGCVSRASAAKKQQETNTHYHRSRSVLASEKQTVERTTLAVATIRSLIEAELLLKTRTECKRTQDLPVTETCAPSCAIFSGFTGRPEPEDRQSRS